MDDLDLYDTLTASPEREAAARAFASALVKTATPTPKPKPKFPRPTASVIQDLKKVQERMKTLVAKGKPPKTAGVKDTAKAVLETAKETVRRSKPELIGGGIGALAGGAYGYLASKRHDPKKPSAMELDAQELLRAHERKTEELKKDKKKAGLTHKLHGVYGRAFADMAKQMREHPVATGAMFGAAGGSAGAGVGRLVHDVAQDL